MVDGKAVPCASVIKLADEVPGKAPAVVLQRRQHAGENLEPQIFFVAQAVGAALDHPDLVVEPLDEAERDLVLKPAVGGDPVPMTIDHRGELLIRLKPLPLEARAPMIEEAPRPALALVAAPLAE